MQDTSIPIGRGRYPLRTERGRQLIPTQVTMPAPMIQELDAAAFQEGMDSRSQLVRVVLADYLKQRPKAS